MFIWNNHRTSFTQIILSTFANCIRQFMVSNRPFSRLSGQLLKLGFTGSKADSSLFIYRTAAVTTYLLIYVDDIIIVSSILTAIDELLQLLCIDFVVKDLGNLHYFLGVKVLPMKAGLLLSQQRYIRDLLHKTNIAGYKTNHISHVFILGFVSIHG